MSSTQYALNWDAFQSSMCSGFSSFQQSGEFVDMTLAADGHMVKVHQMVMALASPFLKELIRNAQCPHPVIYLNNVKHPILCNILEYIYTGEVFVEAHNFPEFILTAKGLHIKGLDTVVGNSEETALEPQSRTSKPQTFATKRPALPSQGIHFIPAKRQNIKNERPVSLNKSESEIYNYEETVISPQDESWGEATGPEATPDANKGAAPHIQYTVSTRGQLQMILNRYLYNLHSTAQGGGQRRWRCVDYRNLRCPALVVTKAGLVVTRSNLHNHAFHDKKILSKIDRKAVFEAIDDVRGVKATTREQNDGDDDDAFGE